MSENAGRRMITERELHERTEEVIAEVLESGRSMLVTRHGRPVATIEPILGVDIEAFWASMAARNNLDPR